MAQYIGVAPKWEFIVPRSRFPILLPLPPLCSQYLLVADLITSDEDLQNFRSIRTLLWILQTQTVMSEWLNNACYVQLERDREKQSKKGF